MSKDPARLRGRADYLALKIAVGEAVALAGGARRAADETRADAPRLSRYASPHEPLHAPLDVALDLDTLSGEFPILHALADLCGFDLMKRGTEAVPADRYTHHLGAVAHDSGDLIAAVADAATDGRVTPAEAARIDQEAAEVERSVRNLRRRNRTVMSGGK